MQIRAHKSHPESDLQIAIVKYCMLRNIPVLHYAAERRCSIAYGVMLRQMGVRAGVCDLMFLTPTNYPVAWLELKAGKNKPTLLQMKFMQEVRGYGHFADWCNSFDAAIKIINELHLRPAGH
jgi:hypothetical protein